MTITCPRCKADNPDGKRFCGDCGASLDAVSAAPKDGPGTSLRDQIESIVKDQYKDQKLVEIETTQAIASRLLDWAKLLAFFVGVPAALLLFIIGILGIRTYADFVNQVDKAQKDVTAHLAAAQTQAAKLQTDGETLAGEYGKLRARFVDTKALADKLEELSHKVDQLEKLAFTTSSDVAPDVRARLEAAFSSFQQYYRNLGYTSVSDITIDIRKGLEQRGMVSYYDPDHRIMVIDSKFADDPIVLYREYSHHVLYSRNPNVSDPSLWSYFALESGLAWFFPCSFVNNPRPPTKATSWDLTKKRRFAEIQPNIGSAMTDGTEVWGSALWELRTVLGQDVGDRLLFETWFKLQPEEIRSDRGAAFVRKLMDANGSAAQQIRAIFAQRGLTL